ncbi:hypothetical protein VM1G_00824 [Cytospora mali]|uniref:Velvet domain-containing protein n=1 Tax=Cytospora mali TaxID=578113 RepID=A0A194VML9_CYTMA|nr:hypothetical protein VM1G_00824 [Valsa mali]
MSSSTQSSREVSVEIVVQPPSTVGVNRRLVPPIVARTSDAQLIEDYLNNNKQVYATAMLTSTSGQDYTPVLNGTWNVNAQLVQTSSSGGGGSSSRHAHNRWLYFIFSPVYIGRQGTYTFSVVVSALSLADGTSLVVGGRTTRQITVANQHGRPGRPSSSERDILRQLQAAGLYSP